MIDLIQNSTIHGLNHIYTARNKYFKIIWIILVLFGIGGIITNVVLIILKFMSKPIGISQTVDYENFTWPDLTFCNPSSPYDLDKNQTFLAYWKQLTEESEELIKTIVKDHAVKESFFNYKIGKKALVMSTADAAKLNFNNFKTIVGRAFYGYSYTDSFLDKHRMAEDVLMDEDRKKIFSADVVEFHQNIPCHTLHFEKSKTVRAYPVSYLNLKLILNQDSYQFYNESFPYKTILAYISSDEHMVEGGSKIVLRTDYRNVVTISQIHVKRNGVRSPCRKEKFKVALYDALLRSTKIFEGNYKHCLQVNRQKIFVKKCNCYSPYLPIYKNETGFPRICFNMSLFSSKELVKNFHCLFPSGPARYEDYDKLQNELDIACERFETPKCDESTYKFELEREGFVRNPEFVNRNVTKGIPGDRYVKTEKLTIIFKKESNSIDLFEEELQYPFSQCLSDIGGLMGLWLGLSVVGLFEIFEFFYTYMKITCEKHKNYEQPPPLEMVF